MKKIPLFLTMLTASMAFTSCKKDEVEDPSGKTPLTIPSEYVSADYDANTVTEASLRSQFKALSDAMKAGNNVANKVDAGNLNNLFTAGSPSLKSVTDATYASNVETWFDMISASSQNTFDLQNRGVGGVYGGNRLLDQYGVETLQLVEKGLYTALFYNYMLNIMDGAMTEADVDRLVSAIGAHASFPNSSSTKPANPDVNLANYICRRDKNDGNGFYTNMKVALIKLKAAIKAGSNYNTEREEAKTAIRNNIEKGLMATVVNYAHSAITKFSSTSPNEATLAGGLHDLSETAGFIHGLRSVPASKRTISDAQIDQLLEKLHVPANGTHALYLFASEPAAQVSRLAELIDIVKGVYSFTDAEINTDFKQNWVQVQDR